jgi:hypothetical protein
MCGWKPISRASYVNNRSTEQWNNQTGLEGGRRGINAGRPREIHRCGDDMRLDVGDQLHLGVAPHVEIEGVY